MFPPKESQSRDGSMADVLEPEKMKHEDDRDIEKLSQAEISQDETPSPPESEPTDPTLIEFDGPNDPENPKNWTSRRRICITASMGLMTFVVTFSSSIFAVAIEPVSKEYNVSTPVATLGVSFFLLGFVVGPIGFGPASEVWGRRTPLFAGYIIFMLFNLPVALATNIETILIGRLIGGIAASAPVAIVGGCMADLWLPVERTYAICVFAAGAFCGPVAGPLVGGFVTESFLGWRWTAWITMMLSGLFGVIGLFVIPETSPMKILQLRARRLRYETRNWALHSKADESPVNIHTIVHVYLVSRQ